MADRQRVYTTTSQPPRDFQRAFFPGRLLTCSWRLVTARFPGVTTFLVFYLYELAIVSDLHSRTFFTNGDPLSISVVQGVIMR